MAPTWEGSRVRKSSAQEACMAESPAVASNIEIARDYTRRVFNGHHPELAAEFVSPDVRWHGGTLGTVEGVENLVALLRGFIGALPDLNAQEQDIVADGDTVALRFVVEATHKGEFARYRADGSQGALGCS